MRFFHLTRGQRGVCGIYSTRLDCQSQPGSPSYPPSSLPACLPGSYDQLCMQHAAKGWLHCTPRPAPPRPATKFTLPQKSSTLCLHCPLECEPRARGEPEWPAKQQRRRQTAKRAANSIRVPPSHTPLSTALPPSCAWLNTETSPGL